MDTWCKRYNCMFVTRQMYFSYKRKAYETIVYTYRQYVNTNNLLVVNF